MRQNKKEETWYVLSDFVYSDLSFFLYIPAKGINNRDLHNFKVDLGVTQKLIRLIPQNKIKVS